MTFWTRENYEDSRKEQYLPKAESKEEIKWNTEDFQGSETTLYDTIKVIHICPNPHMQIGRAHV